MKKLLIGFLSVTILFLSSCQTEEVRYIRKNANTSEASKDVQALDSAFKVMKMKGCDDPTSWYYQAAIHWVPTRIKDNQLCDSYTDWTELKIGWDQCTHSHSGAEEINFLIWHRMYIWHLEKIVRKTSGYEDFALPYWGYTNYDKIDKVMPPMWRDSTSALYEESRLDSLNMGYPIRGNELRVLRGDYPRLMEITDYQTFNQYFDQGIHGSMHNYIGSGNAHVEEHYNSISQKTSTTGMMSDVATAGFDPIFWAHHSNIDRVFQQWLNSPNGQKITLEQLKDNPWKYAFFNENGVLINYTPEMVMEVVYDMDYDYDDEKVSLSSTLKDAKIGVRETIDFERVKVVIDESPKYVGSVETPDGYESDKVLLEIATTFEEVPFGFYEVYINHPEGESFDVESESFAGVMNFFGSNHGDPRNTECFKGCCSPISEDGKLMTVFNYELNTEKKYDITIYRHDGIDESGLMVNVLKLKNYNL